MLLTLDSSVIVAALRDGEPFHFECLRVLRQVREGRHDTVQPLSVLVEVTAAIRRRTGSTDLADRVYRDLRGLGSMRFVELDASRADRAAWLAQRMGLRGMDALVVQVAEEFGSALITLDGEMLSLATGIVPIESLSAF